MANGKPYTSEEIAAARQLYREHRSDWAHHLADYPVLLGRSKSALATYITVHLAGIGRPIVLTERREKWPEPGVILFDDDPREAARPFQPFKMARPARETSYGIVSYGAIPGWVS